MTTTTLQQSIQQQVYRLVYQQLIGVFLLGLAVAIVLGFKQGYSVFLGGMTYGFANLLFVWGVFRFVRASQMTLFVAVFILGELVKVFFSAILFLVIVKTLPVSLLSALAGLFGSMVIFWAVSLWSSKLHG